LLIRVAACHVNANKGVFYNSIWQKLKGRNGSKGNEDGFMGWMPGYG